MSERRLSELARVLSQPSGIVSSDFPKLRRAATRMGITYDLWQQGLLYLMLGKRENGLYACGEGGTVISICRLSFRKTVQLVAQYTTIYASLAFISVSSFSFRSA